MIIPDLHFDANKEIHPAYKVVKRFAKSFKPGGVIFIGDVLDLYYISSFSKDDLKGVSRHTFQADFDLWNRELDYWCKLTDDIVVIEGNHEYRIEKLIQRMPMLEGAVEVGNSANCDYKGRGIKYRRYWEKPYKLGHCHFIHGWFTGIHHAKKHVLRMGDNIVYGHTHDVQSFSVKTLADNHEVSAWSIGCLTDRQPDWLKGRPSSFMHAFGVLYLWDRGNFNLYIPRVIGNQFAFEGRMWR